MPNDTPEVAYKSSVVSREAVCCQGFCHRAVNLAPGVPCSTSNTLLHEDGGGDALYLSQNMLLVTAFSMYTNLAEGLLRF